jgi:hypothetical protein
LTRLVVVSWLDLERRLSRGGKGSPEGWLSWRSAGSWWSVTLLGAAIPHWWSDADAPTVALPY